MESQHKDYTMMFGFTCIMKMICCVFFGCQCKRGLSKGCANVYTLYFNSIA